MMNTFQQPSYQMSKRARSDFEVNQPFSQLNNSYVPNVQSIFGGQQLPTNSPFMGQQLLGYQNQQQLTQSGALSLQFGLHVRTSVKQFKVQSEQKGQHKHLGNSGNTAQSDSKKDEKKPNQKLNLRHPIRHMATQTFQCVSGNEIHGYSNNAQMQRRNMRQHSTIPPFAVTLSSGESCTACLKAFEDATAQAKEKGAKHFTIYAHVPCCSLQEPLDDSQDASAQSSLSRHQSEMDIWNENSRDSESSRNNEFFNTNRHQRKRFQHDRDSESFRMRLSPNSENSKLYGQINTELSEGNRSRDSNDFQVNRSRDFDDFRMTQSRDMENPRMNRSRDGSSSRINRSRDDDSSKMNRFKDDDNLGIIRSRDDTSSRMNKYKDNDDSRMNQFRDDSSSRVNRSRDEDDESRMNRSRDDNDSRMNRFRNNSRMNRSKDSNNSRMNRSRDGNILKMNRSTDNNHSAANTPTSFSNINPWINNSPWIDNSKMNKGRGLLDNPWIANSGTSNTSGATINPWIGNPLMNTPVVNNENPFMMNNPLLQSGFGGFQCIGDNVLMNQNRRFK